jgi:hypothetical protein
MANPIKGEVSVDLPGGRKLILVLDMEALIEAEGCYEKPLPQLMADAAAGYVGAARALFYGSLRAHQRSMLLEDATQIFIDNIDLISERLSAAVELAMASAAETPKPNGKKRSAGGKARPPGGRSGGNGAAKGLSLGTSGA